MKSSPKLSLSKPSGKRLSGIAMRELQPEDLVSLLEISRALTSLHNIDSLLDLIMDKLTRMLKTERCTLFLYNPRTKKMEGLIAQKSKTKITVALGEGIAGYTAQKRKTIICPDTYNDPRFLKFFDRKTGYKTRNLLSTPMISRHGELIGVVEALNKIVPVVKSPYGCFTPYDVSLIEALASQASVAIQNAMLFQDYLGRQIKVERLNAQLTEKLETIQKELKVRYHYGNIIGQSPQMQQMYRILGKAKETSFPVLIQGGSGTGKELVARAIHFNGPRAEQPFLSQNCAAIPDTLLESELFGHIKGAFTGADRDKKGLFTLADHGTLFLDEIGNMSEAMQRKILRVIEDKEVKPVGGKDATKVDVRIVSASNVDLTALMKAKRFREDLFYRIYVITINLPPLRERKEDIPLLINHFLKRIAKESSTPLKRLDEKVMNIFFEYNWPGNIRELENELKKMVALSRGNKLTTRDVSPQILGTRKKYLTGLESPTDLLAEGYTLKKARQIWERRIILSALKDNDWNITRTARALGLHRPRLSLMMKQLGIKPPGKPES